MKVRIELSGGLELIFKKKEFQLDFNNNSENSTVTIKDLVDELKKHILERPDFFLTKDGTVRPGILVIINDADWELFDKENTKLNDNDVVGFISTLHGG